MALGDFAPQAVAYAARPGYPETLLDRLVARAGVVASDRVADLGAGTGIFTMQLAARGLLVDAIDPSDAMRAQAPAHPSVRWRAGSFEATGLADGAVRWIADPIVDEIAHVVTMTRERFRGLWRSHMAETAGAALPRVLAGIDELTAGVEHVEVPYLTRAWPVRAG